MTAELDFGAGFNPLDPVFMNNPGPLLKTARASNPVFFSPSVNAWVVTRFEDVDMVLRNPDTFTSKEVLSINDLLSPEVKALLSGSGVVPMEGTLSGFDQPEHTKLRRVLAPAFSVTRMASLENSVTEMVHTIIDPIKSDRAADLLATLFYPLPLSTISRLIGIPDENIAFSRQAVEDWAALSVAYLMGESLEDQMVLAERIIEGHLFVLRLIEERKAQPKEDLISSIVARQESDDLTDYEMLSMVPGLFLAGHETTAYILSSGLYRLLKDRSAWEALVADPASIDSVAEELLRLESPVFGMWRNVTKDVDIAGVSIPAGSRLYLSFWSANHDDSQFSQGDVFAPELATKQHMSFGRGIHLCIGAPLARLELHTALSILIKELPSLDLAAGFVPSWKPHFFLRGMSELPVTW